MTANLKMSRVLDQENINAMLNALRKVEVKGKKVFDIEKTKETIIVTHAKAGEVSRSLKNNSGWVTRYNKNLFI